MKLTNREKQLLYFLLCFVIVMVGFYYLLMPTMQKNQELNVAYLNANAQLGTLKTTMAQYGDLNNALFLAQEEYDELSSKFYDDIVNEDIDVLLTKLILSNALVPESLQIMPPLVVSIPSHEQYLQLMKQKANPDEATVIDEATLPKIDKIDVAMVVNGSFANVSNLLDDIRNMEATYLGDLHYTSEDDVETSPTISISFTLYLMK